MLKNLCKMRRFLLIVLLIGMGLLMTDSRSQAASQYKIRINKQQNCVTIYKVNEKGKYEPHKAMVCSVGGATPLGTFGLKEKIRWHELDGPVYGQYCTRITGHILFHSVWYAQNNNPATLSCTQYNKLGQVASHGCVRLCVRDSKWIYDNVPMGTPVEIYNDKDPGPLGKPEAIKVPGAWGWDPTDDTNPANPYNNKKPVIALKKGKAGNVNIAFASKIDVLKTITAKNTTGFDVIDKVTYTVKYKASGKAKVKKVKEINTLKSGIYIVKFRVKDEIDRTASLTVKYKVLKQIKLKSVKLNKSEKVLYLGGDGSDASYRLKLKSCSPSNASIRELKFRSSNTSVVTVDDKGILKATGPGVAYVRAKAKDGSGVKTYCTIEVRRYADTVSASVAAPVLKVGEQTVVSTALAPAGANGKKNMSYTYVSSNPEVATVDSAGNVRAVAQGNAVITVTAVNAAQNGNLTAQVNITVNPAESGTDVSESALGLSQ